MHIVYRFIGVYVILMAFLLPGTTSGQITDSRFIEHMLLSSLQDCLEDFPDIGKVTLREGNMGTDSSIFEDTIARALTLRGCAVIRDENHAEKIACPVLLYSCDLLRITVFPDEKKGHFRRHISGAYSLTLISHPEEKVLWVRTSNIEEEDQLLQDDLEHTDDLSTGNSGVQRVFFKGESHALETILAVILLAVLGVLAL